MITFAKQSFGRLKLRFDQRYRADESGVAAMEFAILAPMIIGIYLALAEFAMVLGVERRISHSASVAGDLATQVTSLNSAQAEDLVSAVLHVANFDNPSKYRFRITSFEREADGTVTELGKIEFSSAGVAAFDTADGTSIPEELMPRGSGMVMAEVRYGYSPFGFTSVDPNGSKRRFLPESMLLEETFLLKPRRSSTLEIGTTPGTSINCTGSVSSVNCG